MKLSIVKSAEDSLSKQVEKMNKWNLCVRIRSVVKMMAAMIVGITIPAAVFKSMDYMLTSYRDGIISDFSGGITATIAQSVAIVLGISKWIIIMFALLAVLKLLKTGESKAFWMEILNLVGAWVSLCILRLLPVCVPVVLRAFGAI